MNTKSSKLSVYFISVLIFLPTCTWAQGANTGWEFGGESVKYADTNETLVKTLKNKLTSLEADSKKVTNEITDITMQGRELSNTEKKEFESLKQEAKQLKHDISKVEAEIITAEKNVDLFEEKNKKLGPDSPSFEDIDPLNLNHKSTPPYGLSKKEKYAIGGLAAAAVILLSQDSDTNTNDTETGPINTPETVVPDTEEPSEATPEPIGDSRDGNYNIGTSVASNPANHPVLIQNLLLAISVRDSLITIIQSSNNSNFPRQFNGTINGDAFTLIANGNYAGFNTVFQLVGILTALNQMNFQIIVGGNGSLPSGQPITYNAQGSK